MKVLWECPKCEAANRPAVRECEQCGADRPGFLKEPELPKANTCARCGDTSPSTTAFHEDGAPEDKGVRLCPSCWILALKRRAVLDPISAEKRATLRHELYKHLDTIAARTAVVTRALDVEEVAEL
jgi:hypothetical protein